MPYDPYELTIVPVAVSDVRKWCYPDIFQNITTIVKYREIFHPKSYIYSIPWMTDISSYMEVSQVMGVPRIQDPLIAARTRPDPLIAAPGVRPRPHWDRPHHQALQWEHVHLTETLPWPAKRRLWDENTLRLCTYCHIVMYYMYYTYHELYYIYKVHI